MLKNVSYSREVWLVQADKICNTPTSALHLALYIEGKKGWSSLELWEIVVIMTWFFEEGGISFGNRNYVIDDLLIFCYLSANGSQVLISNEADTLWTHFTARIWRFSVQIMPFRAGNNKSVEISDFVTKWKGSLLTGQILVTLSLNWKGASYLSHVNRMSKHADRTCLESQLFFCSLTMHKIVHLRCLHPYCTLKVYFRVLWNKMIIQITKHQWWWSKHLKPN